MKHGGGLILTVLMFLSIASTSLMSAENAEQTANSDMLVRYTRHILDSGDESLTDLDWTSYGPGISTVDFDSDGDLDLYVSAVFSHLDYQPAQGNAIDAGYGAQMLFENTGDLEFRDVTAASGLVIETDERSLIGDTSVSGAWGDYDSDGHPDLYISRFGHTLDREVAGMPNILYHNNGDGTFTDVTSKAGVSNSGHSTSAQWVDYDHDGDLDLYSLNYGYMYPDDSTVEDETNILYRNEGDGTFSDQTNAAGLSGSSDFSPVNGAFLITPTESPGSIDQEQYGDWGSGLSWSAVWFDYDQDGWEDVFIASDYGISPLYRNAGDGTFEMVTAQAGMSLTGSARGADAGDYDGDGDLDLCQSNFGRNYLWNNQGDGTFIEAGLEAGLGDSSSMHWVCDFFDYDLDGDQDLYFSVGRTNPPYSIEDNELWVNGGEGTFTDMALELNLIVYLDEKTQGSVIADLDNDGDLDIVAGNTNAPIRIFENLAEMTGRHWLLIELRGESSNSAGIGAEVRVYVDGEVQVQQSIACSGSLGCGDDRLHFGLNLTGDIERVVVDWPSGAKSVVEDVAANQILVIEERFAREVDIRAYLGLVMASLLLFIHLHRRH